jgi:hypothetical protein
VCGVLPGLWLAVPLFACSFVPLFVRSFVRLFALFVCFFVRLFFCLFVLFVCALRSFVCLCVCLLGGFHVGVCRAVFALGKRGGHGTNGAAAETDCRRSRLVQWLTGTAATGAVADRQVQWLNRPCRQRVQVVQQFAGAGSSWCG